MILVWRWDLTLEGDGHGRGDVEREGFQVSFSITVMMMEHGRMRVVMRGVELTLKMVMVHRMQRESWVRQSHEEMMCGGIGLD